jgi:hypothetical protein
MSVKSGRCLFVIDFNGVLLRRAKDKDDREMAESLMHVPVYKSNQEDIFLRPYLEKLSKFFDKNKDFCDYALWTSATEFNANLLYSLIKTKGLQEPKFLWNQSACDIIGHTSVKPLFLKDLSKVWKEYPNEYSESNIILIDDDDYKSEHKNNFIHIDRYDVTNEDSLSDKSLKRLVKYLKMMKLSLKEDHFPDCVSFVKGNSFKNFKKRHKRTQK